VNDACIFTPTYYCFAKEFPFFPYRYAAWSLTLGAMNDDMSGWSLANVQKREGMFSPATNSASVEKL
jgi:hypothetical protein